MQFGRFWTGLAIAGLANGAALHNDAHKMHKRALEIVTVTDVVWDVVTLTEYDTVAAATVAVAVPPAVTTTQTTLQQAAATSSPAPAAVAPATSAIQLQLQTTMIPTSSASSAPAAVVPSSSPSSTTSAIAAAGNVAVASSVPAVSAATTGTYAGDGTFFQLGLTACGQYYTNSDYVAAISYKLFDQGGPANPNNNPHCGKKIRVFRNGQSVDVTIVDRCASCEGEYDVDLSPVAFDTLAQPAEGRVAITWSYL